MHIWVNAFLFFNYVTAWLLVRSHLQIYVTMPYISSQVIPALNIVFKSFLG